MNLMMFILAQTEFQDWILGIAAVLLTAGISSGLVQLFRISAALSSISTSVKSMKGDIANMRTDAKLFENRIVSLETRLAVLDARGGSD